MRAQVQSRKIALCLIFVFSSFLPAIPAVAETLSTADLSSVEILDADGRRWRATGTVRSADESVQLAVIEDTDTGATARIRQGTWIFDEFQVEEVTRNWITFLWHGKKINLRVGSGANRAGLTQTSVMPSIEIKQLGPNRFGLSYGDFRSILTAVSALWRKDFTLRVRAANDEGLPQLKSVHLSELLDQLGLAIGDKIIAMQGKVINGFLHAEGVLNEVQPASTVLVVYNRGGDIRQMSIEVGPKDGKF